MAGSLTKGVAHCGIVSLDGNDLPFPLSRRAINTEEPGAGRSIMVGIQACKGLGTTYPVEAAWNTFKRVLSMYIRQLNVCTRIRRESPHAWTPCYARINPPRPKAERAARPGQRRSDRQQRCPHCISVAQPNRQHRIRQRAYSDRTRPRQLTCYQSDRQSQGGPTETDFGKGRRERSLPPSPPVPYHHYHRPGRPAIAALYPVSSSPPRARAMRCRQP